LVSECLTGIVSGTSYSATTGPARAGAARHRCPPWWPTGRSGARRFGQR